MSKKGFTYTLQIDAEINDLIAKTNQVKKSMESVMAAGKAPGAEKLFGTIERAIDRLQQKAAQPIESVAAFNGIQKEATAVGVALGKLGNIIEGFGNLDLADKMDLLPPDLKKKIEEASAALQTFEQSAQKAAQKSKNLTDAETDLATAKRELNKAEGKVTEKKQLITIQESAVKTAQKEAEAIKTKKEALEKFLKTQAAYETAGGDKRKAGGGKKELEGMNLPADRKAATAAMPGLDLKDTQAVQAAIAQLGTEYSQASKKVTDAETTQRRYTKSLGEWENKAQVARGTVSDLEGTVAQLNAEFEKNKAKDTQAAYTKLRTEADKLGVDLANIPVDYTEQNFIELNNAMNQLVADGIADINAGLDTIQNEMEETGISADNFGSKMTGAERDVQALDAQVSQTTAFTQRIAQFVGLQGGIEIARNAMRAAMDTIKELDATMTEMAVVTDLEIGDYWNQLADHTARANELGLAINDVYKAETLYYQQGLKTEQVIAMSTETLKMARIAGLEAEDATNKMTAALRGFNMELNETSSQKVADVYSELAAITAADVDEISTAMTKTASIANSANMEFETTAAFLSQIIETTRESAETAGTAMKTIIARFQELKKDPAEIGEVDGEVIDANKIEGALRTVGVSLRDASGQFRELDDVFLELASKWDTLDTNTQRYVATMAAGSRQQSRFIAMMSDYGRTQELVTAANNSAGASQKQYEKTLSSLETALNRLKNAWDSFTMGLMDSELLTAGVDLLTGLLTAINNITDAFGDFSGAAKIGLLVAALYLGDKALNVFTTSIKEGNTIFQAFGKIGSTAASSIKKTMTDLTKAIKNTTKQEKQLNLVMQSTCGSSTKLAAAKEKVKNAQRQLNDLEKSGTATSSQLAAAKSNLAAQEALLNIQQTANNKIRQESQAMVALGLSSTQAEILALQGHTAAEVQNLIAKEMSNGASAEEARQRALSALGISSETDALTLNDLVRRNGILNFLTQLGLLILGKKSWKDITNSENKNTGSKLLNIIATLAQAAANGTLLATMWPILVATLAIAAAILILVGIIMLIIAAIKAFKKNSPEGQLKSAEEAADAAAEAADRAAESYNNLADAMENLQDKYKSLEELTRGTKEWKDAVKEVNDEVLGLIDEYPELATLVKNDKGVLTLDIESKEVQDVLNKYEKQAAAASSASLAAKINVNEKKANVTSSNLASSNMTYVGDVAYSISNETMQAMAQAMNGGELRDTDGDGKLVAEMTDWLRANGNYNESTYAGSFAVQLANDTEALKEFGAELYAMAEQERVYKEQMAQNAIGMVDATKYTEEQLKQMDVAATADFTDSFTDKYEEQFADMSKEDTEEAKTEVAKNLYGEDATVSGNKITYKDENGDEQTKELTDEEFKEQWAAIEATKAMATAFEQLPKTIDRVASMMTQEAGKAFKAMYAGKEGSAMTKKDIEAANKVTTEELNTFWETLSTVEKESFGSQENFINQYNDNIEAATDALAQAMDLAAAAHMQMMEDINMETMIGYAKQMENAFLLSGENSVNALGELFESTTKDLTQTEKERFLSTLDALDWQSLDSLETFPKLLEDIGISVPNDELKNYIGYLGKISGAIKDLDMEKIHNSVKSLTKLSKNIYEGSQGRRFSEEDYNKIIESIPDLIDSFQQTLDGDFVYLGTSMEELRLAIEQNTAAQLKQAIKQLDNSLALIELLQEAPLNSLSTIKEFSSNHNWSEDEKKAYLTQIQQFANAEGIKIEGIAGFDNDSSIVDLSKEKLEQVFAELNELVGKQSILQNERIESMASSQSLSLQANSAVDNSMLIDPNLNKESLDIIYRTLMAQAEMTEINEELISQYKTEYDLYKANGNNYQDLLDISQKLANAIDYKNMRTGLVDLFGTLGDIVEKYKEMSETDEAGKIMEANNALARFGLQVDNITDAESYMKLVEQVTQGSTDALAVLVGFMQEAEGLSAEYGNAYSEGWLGELSEAQIAFYDSMEKKNLGFWKKTSETTRQFVWATVGEMETIAKEAGTAIEYWENSYTWLYNLNSELTRLTREREKEERKYNSALEDSSKSAKDLLDISKEELTTLQEQANMQQIAQARALDDIQQKFETNQKYSQYVQYDAASNSLIVDYTGLENANFTEEEGQEFEEFLSVLEENQSIIYDAEEALWDIEDDIKQIKERGKSETSTLYNQIKQGLIQERQEEIDKLQTINDSIQDTQSALIGLMQQQIDEARQARENEKTEQSIVDKEARLAYLMSDTSGGNALEIAQLQKELEEDKLSYSDTLVDQRLQSLQDANERAAKQRQQQIEIAQQQLDAYAVSQEVWDEVERILSESLLQAQAAEDWEWGWKNSEAARLISSSENIAEKNPIEQSELADEITNNAKLSSIYTGVAGMSKEQAETVLTAALSGDITSIKDALISKDGENVVTTLAAECDNLITDLTVTGGLLDTTKNTIGKLGDTSLTGGVGSIIAGAMENAKKIVSAIGRIEIPKDDPNPEPEKPPVTPQNSNTNVGASATTSKTKAELLEKRDTEDYVKSQYEAKYNGTSEIQSGINALLDFTSGGGDFKSSNSSYQAAKKKYKDSGGVGDFDALVSDAFASGSGYSFNDKYDKNTKEIITGTFPDMKVDGLGNGVGDYDKATFVFADGASAVVQVPRKKKNIANGSISQAINDMYGEAGLNPADGWSVLYKGTPYVYNEGSWRYFDDTDGSKNAIHSIMRKNLNPHFKTGGLADFTGPAWLDGTKSKPEIVLNQQDSANFMQLRDILAEVLHGASDISSQKAEDKGGDNYFDIEINVENISDDYDVEQMAEKIKSMIYDDAMYRNVNALSQ